MLATFNVQAHPSFSLSLSLRPFRKYNTLLPGNKQCLFFEISSPLDDLGMIYVIILAHAQWCRIDWETHILPRYRSYTKAYISSTIQGHKQTLRFLILCFDSRPAHYCYAIDIASRSCFLCVSVPVLVSRLELLFPDPSTVQYENWWEDTSRYLAPP